MSFRQAQTTTRQVSGQPGQQSKALPQPKHLVNKTYEVITYYFKTYNKRIYRILGPF